MFSNRSEAGARLAKELARFKGSDPVVLALPRGGVPVAFEVACALGAPLDLVVVGKIGAPHEPELEVAAAVDGERVEIVTNDDVVRERSVPQTWIRDQSGPVIREIERRRRFYLADHDRPEVRGKTAIVVDDGVATGTKTRAALRAVRHLGPKRLVLAVPVAPAGSLADLRTLADEVVCLATPPMFGAIGQFYRDFSEVDDADVRDLLKRAPRREEHPPI